MTGVKRGMPPLRKVLDALPGSRMFRLSCGHHARLKDACDLWPCHMCLSEENRAARAAQAVRGRA
jgi:hypothetical protein